MLVRPIVLVYILLPLGSARSRSWSRSLRSSPRGPRRCGEPPEMNPNSEYSQEFSGNVEVAVYDCVNDFLRHGERFSHCRRGKWSHPAPHCYRLGCSDLNMTNLLYEKVPNGLYTNIRCFPGYKPSKKITTIRCLGKLWDESPPRCAKEVPSIHLPHNCNFESRKKCGWKPDMLAPLYWRLNKGKTPTPGTGPERDHSRPKPGYYMYMETTNIGETAFADLYSPLLKGNMSALLGGAKRCLAFWYHMHGAGIGNLSVLLRFDKDTLDEAYNLHTIEGPQGDQWLNFQAELPDTKRDYQLIIRGDPGGQDEGDIALDDIFIGASCPSLQRPVIELKLPPEAYGNKAERGQQAEVSTSSSTETTSREVTTRSSTPQTTTARSFSIHTTTLPYHDDIASSATTRLLWTQTTPLPQRPSTTESIRTTVRPRYTSEATTTARLTTMTPSSTTDPTTKDSSKGFRPTTESFTTNTESEYVVIDSSTTTLERRSTIATTETATATSTKKDTTPVTTEPPSSSSSIAHTSRSHSSSFSGEPNEVTRRSTEVNSGEMFPAVQRGPSVPRRRPIVPEKVPIFETESSRLLLGDEHQQHEEAKRQRRESTSAFPIVSAAVSVGLISALLGTAAVVYLFRRNQGNSFRVLQTESHMSLPMEWIGPLQSSGGGGGMVEPVLDDCNTEEVDARYECRTKLLPLAAI